MSQTSPERRHFPVPTSWPYAGSDPSRPGHYARRSVRSLIRSERCRDAYSTLPISPVCRSPCRILSASHPTSRSAPPSNPHSARCTTSAQLPATSCLGAFRPPASGTRGQAVVPAAKTCTEPDFAEKFDLGQQADVCWLACLAQPAICNPLYRATSLNFG
jgi:hypothetical protein